MIRTYERLIDASPHKTCRFSRPRQKRRHLLVVTATLVEMNTVTTWLHEAVDEPHLARRHNDAPAIAHDCE